MSESEKRKRYRSNDGWYLTLKFIDCWPKVKATLTAQANDHAGSPQRQWEKNPESNLISSIKNMLGLQSLTPVINWTRWGKQEHKKKKVWFKSTIAFFPFREREGKKKESTNTAQWTLSWQTLKELTGPNKSPSERLVSDKVKVIKSAEYIMNKTTPARCVLNLIHTTDFRDFSSAAVSICKWRDFYLLITCI